jgi:hypothetical protein
MSTQFEVACDESGFSGTNLLDPASPVITHASVDLDVPAAAGIIAVLRTRLRQRTEYKSNQLLRPEQRPSLEWLLTTLQGHAHVHVIDKTSYVAARVLELFTEEPADDPIDVLPEVRPQSDGPCVDARFGLAAEKRLTGVLPTAPVSHRRNRPANLF